jgi:hypothetical protein
MNHLQFASSNSLLLVGRKNFFYLALFPQHPQQLGLRARSIRAPFEYVSQRENTQQWGSASQALEVAWREPVVLPYVPYVPQR